MFVVVVVGHVGRHHYVPLGCGSVGVLKNGKDSFSPLGRNFFGREVDRASRTASKGLVLYY